MRMLIFYLVYNKKMEESKKQLNKEAVNNVLERFDKIGYNIQDKFIINNSLTNFIEHYQLQKHRFVNYELPFSGINSAIKSLHNSLTLNNNISQLINYSESFQNFLINNNNFMQMSNAVKTLQDSFAIKDYFKEISAQQEAISKMFSSTAIRDLALYQQQLIEKLEKFDIEHANPQEFIDNIAESNLEEQFEVINSENNSKVKDYLRQNHLMILSIVIPIIFFIWQNCHNTMIEQNNKIISLLEENKKLQIELLEVNQKRLSEEQIQAEVINMQTELLKEMIADIKANVETQNIKK